jgi:hypothetical protein
MVPDAEAKIKRQLDWLRRRFAEFREPSWVAEDASLLPVQDRAASGGRHAPGPFLVGKHDGVVRAPGNAAKTVRKIAEGSRRSSGEIDSLERPAAAKECDRATIRRPCQLLRAFRFRQGPGGERIQVACPNLILTLYADAFAQGRNLGGDRCRKQRANTELNQSAHRKAPLPV